MTVQYKLGVVQLGLSDNWPAQWMFFFSKNASFIVRASIIVAKKSWGRGYFIIHIKWKNKNS